MRGKANNPTALKYHINAVERCINLAARLEAHTYEVGQYYPFEVYEPKHRLVQALNFEGKVVQHSYCDNALYGAICRRLITDNYAVQVGKTRSRDRDAEALLLLAESPRRGAAPR